MARTTPPAASSSGAVSAVSLPVIDSARSSRAPVPSTAPPISRRWSLSGLSAGTCQNNSASATPPSGRLMANTSRQLQAPSRVSTSPPITGPAMVVKDEADDQMPMAPPRSSRG